ncbi:CHASE2 domain-containing protein [uncultured Desulfuromusa sp.]|uniref:CHASE2 domain-containing protein n=1 Tax=uncultured Desulfuromusa sp. TaxID=219183 RepID=UPI002AA869B6|nr:CHASE2 domain-containing protein [uncultured Desulfuromusa sp.]
MQNFPKYIALFLIVLGIHFLIYISGIIPFFDYRCFDLMTSHISAPFTPDSGSTVVVEIDEESLQQLGQWPWPRLILAKTLQEILIQQPAAVGLDIFFPEPDRTSPSQIISFYKQLLGLDVQLHGFPVELTDHDRILAEVLRSGPTVLPLFASQDTATPKECQNLRTQKILLPKAISIPESNSLLCNTPALQQAAQGFGYINASVDSDGVFRRQPLIISYKGQGVPSLSLAMLSQVDSHIKMNQPTNRWSPLRLSFTDKTIPMNRRGEVLNPLYPKEFFTRIPVSHILSGHTPDNLFTGKMVLIGASAAGLYDQYITSAGAIIPGVFVHAALLENIINGRGLYQPDYSKNIAFLLSFLLSLTVVYFVFERKYLTSWVVFLGATLISILAAWFALSRGVYISPGFFLTPFLFMFSIFSLFFAILHYIERKRFLEDLGEAHSATIDSMTMVAESRDVETGVHIIRTKEYIKILATYLQKHNHFNEKKLGPHFIELLFRAAPLHDIGKVGIPDAILKKPARLNAHEVTIMQSHVEIGRTIIENAINNYNKTNEFLTIASNMTYSHHEKWDGSGYPLGLCGTDIPLEGRMMALADVYDALISRRCYKEPIFFDDAEKMIIAERGKHFDPMIIDAFIDLKNEFRHIAERYVENDDLSIPNCKNSTIIDNI